MQSYLDSPQYQAMMAQVLKGSQRGPQYPAEAGINALATALQAYQLKGMQQQGEAQDTEKQNAYATALGNLAGPSDNSTWDAGGGVDASGNPAPVNVSPRVGGSRTERLAAALKGSPELAQQMGPELARQLTAPHPMSIGPTGTAYDPLSLKAGDSIGDPRLKSQAQIDQENAQKAAPGPPPQPTAGMSPEAFEQQKKLAQIKADIAAQVQGEFGRSMQGKSYNILAAGLKDPSVRSTPEYATAWQILSNPRVDPNTGTIVTPDLSAFAPPTGGQPQQPGAPAGAPGAPPPQRMPSVQSFAPPNPSQPEAASAGYANRLSESAKLIDQNQGAGASLFNRTVSGLPGGNYAVGRDYQQLDQAERNFVNAQLRRESGAAISESEFQNARKQYFPQPGDKPEVLAQKKKARDMAVQNMQLSAGNTLLPPGVIQQSSPPKGAPMVPQQQGFGATAPAASGGWKIERVQ